MKHVLIKLLKWDEASDYSRNWGGSVSTVNSQLEELPSTADQGPSLSGGEQKGWTMVRVSCSSYLQLNSKATETDG